LRKITAHLAGGDTVNHQIEIQVVGCPGQDGYDRWYRVTWNRIANGDERVGCNLQVGFHDGSVDSRPVNGVTPEVLLAILIDRFSAIQAGPRASPGVERALHHCERALVFALQTEESD
jgi:hypothetical protein